MIDLNTFILNASSSDEPGIELSSDIKMEDDALQEDAVIDPNSFIFLMAQVLSNLPVEEKSEAPIEETVSTNTPISTDKHDLPQANQEMASDELIASIGLEETNTIPLNQTTAIQLQNNIALAWIDSASFQQMASSSISLVQKDDVESQTSGKVQISQINENNDFLSKNRQKIEDEDVELKPTNMLLTSKEQTQPQSKTYPINFSEINTINEIQSLVVNTSLESKTNDIMIQGSIDIDNLPVVNSFLNQPQNTLTMDSVKYLEIPVEMNRSEWADQFSDQIIWLGNQEVKSALIKLNPEELGPLEINVNVVNNVASVTINSHSDHVRTVVEQALPRLKEMMTDQGIYLTDVSVSSDTNAQQSRQHANQEHNASLPDEKKEFMVTPLNKKFSRGLVDYLV